jgi:hypothetical protein
MDLVDLLSCEQLNVSLEQRDLFDIFVMLEGHEGLDVISLESKKLLVLLIVDDEQSVLLLLDLLLKEHIEGGGLHESMSEINWKNNVHHVDLLNDDSVGVKLLLKLVHHLLGEFSLDVSNSRHLNPLHEISDLFVTLFLEQLFESVWSKVVEESFDVLLLGLLASSNMEINTDIN